MNHDVIEIDGVQYKAVEARGCKGCALDKSRNCNVSVMCCSDERDDRTSVSYKRHYKLVIPLS